MKLTTRMLALCLLVGGLWTFTEALADDLPDLGESPSAQMKAETHATASDYTNRDAVCTKCHDESETKPILSIFATKHGVKGDPRTPTCQACHGESEAHVKNAEGKSTRPAPDIRFGTKRGTTGSYAVSEPKVQNTACLSCHDKDKNRARWEGGPHNADDLACASCHTLHAKNDKVRDRLTQPEVCFACHKERRADSMKYSHHPIAEGKVVCSDCHNPHGSAGSKLLKKNTVTETCYTCHAEKRGPFLWEHQPATEDCTNCHNPHGSNIAPLLKSRPPFLCDECHDGPHNSQSPFAGNVGGIQNGFKPATPNLSANPSSSAAGRACMNCHVMVHGSNSPSGAFLHR